MREVYREAACVHVLRRGLYHHILCLLLLFYLILLLFLFHILRHLCQHHLIYCLHHFHYHHLPLLLLVSTSYSLITHCLHRFYPHVFPLSSPILSSHPGNPVNYPQVHSGTHPAIPSPVHVGGDGRGGGQDLPHEVSPHEGAEEGEEDGPGLLRPLGRVEQVQGPNVT